MNAMRAQRRHLVPLIMALAAGLLAAALVALAPSSSADTSHNGHGTSAAHKKPTQAEFHDAMRKLWEDHVTWTRLAIVTFADESDSFGPTAARLLQNQADIGDAIKPFYGETAGEQLTLLLTDHITIAVELLQAAKAGDTAAFDDANARWIDNANDIADFLAAANPRFWPQDLLRDMMQTHLTQTLTEAAAELSGDYQASIEAYEEIHLHILDMADVLSSGIIRQFPSHFRG